MSSGLTIPAALLRDRGDASSAVHVSSGELQSDRDAVDRLVERQVVEGRVPAPEARARAVAAARRVDRRK